MNFRKSHISQQPKFHELQLSAAYVLLIKNVLASVSDAPYSQMRKIMNAHATPARTHFVAKAVQGVCVFFGILAIIPHSLLPGNEVVGLRHCASEHPVGTMRTWYMGFLQRLQFPFFPRLPLHKRMSMWSVRFRFLFVRFVRRAMRRCLILAKHASLVPWRRTIPSINWSARLDCGAPENCRRGFAAGRMEVHAGRVSIVVPQCARVLGVSHARVGVIPVSLGSVALRRALHARPPLIRLPPGRATLRRRVFVVSRSLQRVPLMEIAVPGFATTSVLPGVLVRLA